MLDSDSTTQSHNDQSQDTRSDASADSGGTAAAPRKRAPRKATAKAGAPATAADRAGTDAPAAAPEPAAPAAAEAAPPRRRSPRKAAAASPEPAAPPVETITGPSDIAEAPAPARRSTRRATEKPAEKPADKSPTDKSPADKSPADKSPADKSPADKSPADKSPADKSPADKSPADKSPAEKTTAKKAPARRVSKKAAAAAQPALDDASPAESAEAALSPSDTALSPSETPAKRTPRKRTTKKAAAAAAEPADAGGPDGTAAPAMAAPGVLFMAPTGSAVDAAPKRRRPAKKAAAESVAPEPVEPEPGAADITAAEDAEDQTAEPEDVREAAIEQASGARRRRRRGRRGRGGAARSDDDDAEGDDSDDTEGELAPTESAEAPDGEAGDDSGEGGTHRRRRRRRSSGSDDSTPDDPPNTVTHVREPKQSKQSQRDDNDDGVRGVKGSTRLEAKRQRRRDGRETTRRRAPIISEAEFLARRESVDRVMAVRQNGDRTQIAVLEDNILVEHYVTRASATSYVGNVYLGRVQNVLPSMEAAFIDIGKGRNGVLYAGEVNWDAAGLEGKSRAIEQALKSGDAVLVQVTKDPIGHKGARLTSQVSLPGRFLVYVPGGGMTGISRRLPDTERHRLKSILKKIVPEDAGVIVRTAAEGASEEDLTRDVDRLKAQWESIQKKAANTKAAPSLVHGEPDLATRVVRDVFNEDFKSLVVQGSDVWETVSDYVGGVAPDLAERVSRHTKDSDLFHDLRVDEQLMKALDRKVWLPSGGSLVIDRTEAMTVIDVNTGKFVGAGGNLEQTVTRNNLEAAEEIVHQLRLRDVGGIVVIDFIDMVLESNRELVLRRLTECLGRDRTKHQVAEVTSLGLVQMTRKRVGEGLLEAFSETCEHCHGRGVLIQSEPIDKPNGPADDEDRGPGKQGKRKRGGRTNAAAAEVPEPVEPPANEEQRRAASAAIAAIHRAANGEDDEKDEQSGTALVDELATGLVAAAMHDDAVSSNGHGPAAEPERRPEAESDVEVEVDAGAASEVEPQPVAAEPGRRRRRGASRPAGPPTS